MANWDQFEHAAPEARRARAHPAVSQGRGPSAPRDRPRRSAAANSPGQPRDRRRPAADLHPRDRQKPATWPRTAATRSTPIRTHVAPHEFQVRGRATPLSDPAIYGAPGHVRLALRRRRDVPALRAPARTRAGRPAAQRRRLAAGLPLLEGAGKGRANEQPSRPASADLVRPAGDSAGAAATSSSRSASMAA